MSQTSHSAVSSGGSIGPPGGEPGGSTTNINIDVADVNVAQLLIEAVLVLKKIEYHLSLMTDTDLSNTEF